MSDDPPPRSPRPRTQPLPAPRSLASGWQVIIPVTSHLPLGSAHAPLQTPASARPADEEHARPGNATAIHVWPTPVPEPKQEPKQEPKPALESTLKMTQEALASERPRTTTLIMTSDEARTPVEQASTETKVMSAEAISQHLAAAGQDLEAFDRPAPPRRLGDKPWTLADTAPHTKMMPLDVLMKRAGARAPIPGIVNGVGGDFGAKRSQPDNASLFGRIRKGWQNTSFVRKASLILMPFLFAVVLARYFKPVSAPRSPRGSAVAAASAKTPLASASAVQGMPPAEAAPGQPAAPSLASVSDASTLERRAVDALAEGNYAAALELYRGLAQAHPGTDAYREAARILEDRQSRK